MARKKKPVDDTPICDPAYVRRIDPLWMPGPVPQYFWEDEAHRRDYLLWSAWRLGLRTMKDLYRLDLVESYKRNGGGGLADYWVRSPLAALRECFPEFDWKPWLFAAVPEGFWDSPANRRSYLDWLGKELGFRRPEDWYRVGARDFQDRHGGTLLHRYASLYDLLRESLPQLDWDRVDVHRVIRVEEILARAEAHHARCGAWPTQTSGEIPGTGDTWRAINDCLQQGLRGLPGGISLARFLEKHRGVRDGRRRPNLSEEQVLAWADAHFAACGRWPTCQSGTIAGTDERWSAVQNALRLGLRGLSPGGSLAKLLAERRGTGKATRAVGSTARPRLPPLTEEQILAWADACFAARGSWPNPHSGQIPCTRETWRAVQNALASGGRGLRKSTLAKLLAARRDVRNGKFLPPLTESQILGWADAYFVAHRNWPTRESGPIPGTQENWSAVVAALRAGGRGLRPGSSLAGLLAARRGARNPKRPPLTEPQILAWAKEYFQSESRWPSQYSGPIAQSPHDTWTAVDRALSNGIRGLPGGSSLAKLLRKHGLK